MIKHYCTHSDVSFNTWSSSEDNSQLIQYTLVDKVRSATEVTNNCLGPHSTSLVLYIQLCVEISLVLARSRLLFLSVSHTFTKGLPLEFPWLLHTPELIILVQTHSSPRLELCWRCCSRAINLSVIIARTLLAKSCSITWEL